MQAAPAAVRRRPGARAARGFTLLEVLVASAVFVLLAVVGYAGLHAALGARDRVAAELDGLQRLQTAFMLLGRDLDQVLPRPVRDGHGGQRAAIAGAAAGAGLLLELTRGGWANPAGARRSALQRVSYVLDGDALRREASGVLDGAVQPGSARVLLQQVRGVTLRFLDGERRWHAQWPPSARGGGRLLAVELELDVGGWGRLRRLFPVGPGGGA